MPSGCKSHHVSDEQHPKTEANAVISEYVLYVTVYLLSNATQYFKIIFWHVLTPKFPKSPAPVMALPRAHRLHRLMVWSWPKAILLAVLWMGIPQYIYLYLWGGCGPMHKNTTARVNLSMSGLSETQ